MNFGFHADRAYPTRGIWDLLTSLCGDTSCPVEMRIFPEEWVPRIPECRIDPKDRVITASGVVNAVEHLLLGWDVPAEMAAAASQL